jgi:hypothetical protein
MLQPFAGLYSLTNTDDVIFEGIVDQPTVARWQHRLLLAEWRNSKLFPGTLDWITLLRDSVQKNEQF